MLRVREIVDPFASPDLRYEAYGWYKGLWFDIPFATFTQAWVYAHTRNCEEMYAQ